MIAKWIKQLFTRKPAEEWVTVAIAKVTWCGAACPIFFQAKGDRRRVTHKFPGYEGMWQAKARIEWERFGKLPEQAVMIENT